jgi:hypothetical protein
MTVVWRYPAASPVRELRQQPAGSRSEAVRSVVNELAEPVPADTPGHQYYAAEVIEVFEGGRLTDRFRRVSGGGYMHDDLTAGVSRAIAIRDGLGA